MSSKDSLSGGADDAPPVGMVLYVLAKVSGVPFERCVIATAPFLVPLLIVLVLLTFIPALSMWLPTFLYH